jgi:hypothetical protein
MGRWSLRACVFLLLICCAAIAVAWVTSYVREDRLVVSRNGTCVQAISGAGRVRLFRFYDYPTPLPWIWEHGEEGRPPGRRIGRLDLWRGQGGTMEFFAIARHEAGYGPIRIVDGVADTDSTGKAVQARRVPGVPQYVSARERTAAAATTRPVTANLPDVEIDRLIKSPGVAERPVNFALTGAFQAKPLGRSNGVFEVPPSDGFTLAPAIKASPPQGRVPMSLAGGRNFGGVSGISGTPLVKGIGMMFPRYAYDEVSTPYWLLLLGPLSPLLLLSIIRLRRRHVRRRRQRTGHCVACGYDLRETVGLCPECGNAK